MKIPATATLLTLTALLAAGSARAQFTVDNEKPVVVPAAPNALANPSATPLRDVSNVLAHAGSEDFTVEDIRPYTAKLTAEQKAALAKDPETLKKFVRTFLVQRLLIQQARAAKWDEQPAVLVQLQRVKENAIADGYLADAAKVPADYPSDAELRAAYDANKDAFISPRQLRLAQILVEAPKDPEKKAQDLAEARVALLVKELNNPRADFLKTAKTRGEETNNAIRGGEIGWVPEAQIPAELHDAVVKLPAGAISEPVRLKPGWVIVKVLEIKEPAPISLDNVRPLISQKMREAKARQLSEAYVNQLVEKNPITINESALTGLLAPATQ